MSEPAASGVVDAVVLDSPQSEARDEPAWGAVVSMALGVFGLVTAEFLPASLLTPMAQDLGVSEGAAGQAVTVTAVVGAIAAPTMAIITKRLDRRVVMWIFTLLLIASNLLAAFATSLTMLLLARVVLGIGLGGFWSMSGAMAMRLVPMPLLPRAMSIILAGVSIATVCAAPIGAYVGDIWGWRAAFQLATLVGMVTLLWQFVTIPRLPSDGGASFRALFEVASKPMIRVGLALILLVASGHFAGFTYVRPFLERVPVLDVDRIALVLLAFGIGGFFGNLAGGFVVARNLRAAASLAPLLMALTAARLLAFGTSHAVAAIAVTAWGFAFGAVPVAVQTWMVRAAPDRAESAGGLMVATFQVALALGAIAGGLLVDHAGVAGAFVFCSLATLLAALTMFRFGPRG